MCRSWGEGKREIKMWKLNTLVFDNVSNYLLENKRGYCIRIMLPQRCHLTNIGQILWLHSTLEFKTIYGYRRSYNYAQL